MSLKTEHMVGLFMLLTTESYGLVVSPGAALSLNGGPRTVLLSSSDMWSRVV